MALRRARVLGRPEAPGNPADTALRRGAREAEAADEQRKRAEEHSPHLFRSGGVAPEECSPRQPKGWRGEHYYKILQTRAYLAAVCAAAEQFKQVLRLDQPHVVALTNLGIVLHLIKQTIFSSFIV